MHRPHTSEFVLMLLAGVLSAGCSGLQPTATAAPASTAAKTAPSPLEQAGEIFPFKIGALEAVALKDGDIQVANDGKTFGKGRPTTELAALLAVAGQPTDVLNLSIQPLLVRSDARLLLFDTGAADAAFARAGRLQASLRAAGVEPLQVTDIFISHRHPDHVGGLLTREGALTFANATIHLSSPEWDALKADSSAAVLAAAIAPKVAPFQPGATILPGVVTAVSVDGHTPGHSAYEITSGEERLLYLGDSAHHYVVSVQRPGWTVAFDENASLAEASRRALLQRAADDGLRIYSVHFPFPGLGRVQARDASFVWVPER